MATPINANSILDLIKVRRTYYALNKELLISKDRVQEIVQEALKHVPSPLNSQSNRVVVLFDDNHDKLWDIARDVLKSVVSADMWEATAAKMAGFKAAAATILFFEDQDSVKEMQVKYPFVHDKFPVWANQSDAMLQFTLWTALETEGFGANLQHYDPIIDTKVAAEFDIPENWKLNAQLVFGGRAGEPGEKEFMPIDARYKVFGA